MAWFDNINELVLPTEGDLGKSIYRIIPFDAFLQLFTEKKNILVKTTKWEDSYENFMLKEQFVYKGNPESLNSFQDRIFGQCWTTRPSSDALWRIYSPDKKSVRIKTTVGKLWRSANSIIDGKCIIGKVHYLPQSIIQNDLQNASFSVKELADLVLSSFFVKRNSFSHESEYRLIYMCEAASKDKDRSATSFDIDPLDFIMNIYFDPRADDAFIDRCKKVMVKAFGYPSVRIRKSSLYVFNPISIQVS